jgi:PAS domain S-box-containing protein
VAQSLYLLIFFLLAAVAWLAASGLEQMVRQMHTTLAELRLGEARYRLLAENAADVIWELDTATMRFTYVSPSIVRLRGYTPAEALTQSLEQILTPPSLDMVNAELPKHIQAFLAGGPAAVPRMYEVEQRCKDGTTVWTEMTATLMRNAAGGVNVLGVSRDVRRPPGRRSPAAQRAKICQSLPRQPRCPHHQPPKGRIDY